jgi:cystathionine beta-synthase
VLKKGQRCVVLLPDSVRNYMSKFLNDDWMWRQGFVDEEHNIGVGEKSHERDWWARRTVGDLGIPVSRLQLRLTGSTSARDFLLLQTPVTATPDVTCNEAVDILQSLGYDQLPVVGEDNTILGVVTEGNLTSRLMSGRVKPSDPCNESSLPAIPSSNDFYTTQRACKNVRQGSLRSGCTDTKDIQIWQRHH